MPVALADEIAALLAGAGDAEIVVGDGTITVRVGDAEVSGALLADAYPDHRRLPWDRWTPGGTAAVDAAGLRVAVVAAPTRTSRTAAVDAAGLRAAVVAAPTRTSRREQDGVEFRSRSWPSGRTERSRSPRAASG